MRHLTASSGLLASGLQEAFGLARQTSSGVHDLHPRRIAIGLASVWFLIGESGEPAQMTPIGAGAVAAIEVRQVPAQDSSESRLQGSRADMNPGLPMTATGLKHDARFVAVVAHRRQRRGIGLIQVDQDIAALRC